MYLSEQIATDTNGNKVQYGFVPHEVDDRGIDRYYYDNILPGHDDDWQSFSTQQDAIYFGILVNLVTFQTFTYCEGDTTLTTCADQHAMASELARLNESYGEVPAFAKTIHEDGTVDEHKSTRPHYDSDGNLQPSNINADILSMLGVQ